MFTRLAMIVLGTTLLTASGCTQDPVAPGTSSTVTADVPPVPENVVLTVSPRQIVVTWTIPAGSGVTNYRVYRATGTGGYDVLGSTANLAYTDNSVATAQTYHYQVAAVKGGLESVRSVTVTATPNVHAIVLDGGVAATAADDVLPGSRQIVVGLVAPETTVSFRLSENADLSGSTEQSFDAADPVGLFALSAGDGMKTVYAQFADLDGSLSQIVSASIVLDTRAVIESVSEDSGGSVLGVNDILHVSVVVDTTGGIASVSLA
ncbi:fibronectin type III domain-containing protein, partial [bacterium]|nr:fibronectin type III domain-containing protein [bacterium]